MQFGNPLHRAAANAIESGRSVRKGSLGIVRCCAENVKFSPDYIGICKQCGSIWVFDHHVGKMIKNYPGISKQEALEIIMDDSEDTEKQKQIVSDVTNFTVIKGEEKTSQNGDDYMDILVKMGEGYHRWILLAPAWNHSQFVEFCQSIDMMDEYHALEIDAETIKRAEGYAEIKRTRDWRWVEVISFISEAEYNRQIQMRLQNEQTGN